MVWSSLKVVYEVLYSSLLLSKQCSVCFCGCKSIYKVVCFIGSQYSIAHLLSDPYVHIKRCSCEEHYWFVVPDSSDTLIFYQLQIQILSWEGNLILQGHAFIVGVFVFSGLNKTASWSCFLYLVSAISGYMMVACCLLCVSGVDLLLLLRSVQFTWH